MKNSVWLIIVLLIIAQIAVVVELEWAFERIYDMEEYIGMPVMGVEPTD